jgi:hypothetical protein
VTVSPFLRTSCLGSSRKPILSREKTRKPANVLEPSLLGDASVKRISCQDFHFSIQCSAEQSDGVEVCEYRTVTGSIGEN